MSIAEDILHDHGILLTDTRTKVIEYILEKQTACSMKELQKALAMTARKEKPVNKTTFYRTIDLFEENGIVHRIDDGSGTAKYTISKHDSTEEKWHLHFRCEVCNRTFCLPDRVPNELLSIRSNHHVKKVNMVLQGICEKCDEN